MIPNLHDSRLWRIETRESHEVVISFRTTENEMYELTMSGVRHFKCDNLLEGNIVLNLQIIDTAKEIGSVLNRLLAHESRGQVDYVRRLAQEIQEGIYRLILINSSYGCEVTSVCKSFGFETRP